jgi:hypothetical protein
VTRQLRSCDHARIVRLALPPLAVHEHPAHAGPRGRGRGLGTKFSSPQSFGPHASTTRGGVTHGAAPTRATFTRVPARRPQRRLRPPIRLPRAVSPPLQVPAMTDPVGASLAIEPRWRHRIDPPGCRRGRGFVSSPNASATHPRDGGSTWQAGTGSAGLAGPGTPNDPRSPRHLHLASLWSPRRGAGRASRRSIATRGTL